MKKFSFVMALAFCFALLSISCSSVDETIFCDAQTPCPEGYACDLNANVCKEKQVAGEDSDNSQNDGIPQGDTASDNPGDSDIVAEAAPDLDQTIIVKCTPGEKAECYEGPSGSKGVGICKAGTSTCNYEGSGWSNCEGMVTPIPETCGDGIDQNCDGVDATTDNTTDIDGDGFTYCTGDCCEYMFECGGMDPKKVNPSAFEVASDQTDNNCNGQVDETVVCDTGVTVSADPATSAVSLAKAMDACEGFVSAELGLAGTAAYEDIQEGPNSSTDGSNPNPSKHRLSLPSPYYDSKYQTYAVEPKFGSVIKTIKGEKIAILSTGPWNAPSEDANQATLEAGDMKTCSEVPSDWINTQKDCTFPQSPSCQGGSITTDKLKDQCSGKSIPTVQDPIMLTVKMKVPVNANSFRFNMYFFSIEYPQLVCTEYNDIAVVLLDSTYNDVNPTSPNPNPWDKNIGKDDKGNPLGVNMAPNGLFKQCNLNCGGGLAGMKNTNQWKACVGEDELVGTGFHSETTMGMCSGHGGTGWLVTAGNVVPGETITLRIAVWETGKVGYGPDHSYDDTVLLDKFEWRTTDTKPGTGIQD